MEQPIISIRNLICEYIKDKPVLRLRQFDLPAGKLVFIIGRSGIGKSTLIETLGLMNKTMAPNPQTSVVFTPSGTDTGFELRDYWSRSNAELAEFRRKFFSFVFQNTNLMPNFTSGENMMISLLIKGKSRAQAQSEVLRVMERISLDPAIFDKKITEISGGQRQRLAFVRAITADFTVLFGDEPTGNLDKNTADELMAFLKEQIQEKGKTGIIVSHDLYLAEKYGDIVAPITAEWGTMGGDIAPGNIISKRADGLWYTTTGQVITDVQAYLNGFLSTKTAENHLSN